MTGRKKFNIVILHGTYGDPGKNWFGWLKRELERKDHRVAIPKFPTPTRQTIENWIAVLDKHITAYDNSLILVGHSSSPLVICAKLQQLKKPVRAAFFVVPFLGSTGSSMYDRANSNFNSFPFNWNKIRKRSKRFYIYRSNNDPYVPEEAGKIMAKKLGVDEIVIKGGGHLNAESGYDTFPRLFNDIQEEISS